MRRRFGAFGGEAAATRVDGAVRMAIILTA
jgi:hypothetical protein